MILELHKQSLSQRVIASEIGRSGAVIANLFINSDAYGTEENTGGPEKISLALGKKIV